MRDAICRRPPVRGLCLCGCVFELCGEFCALPCGVMVDLDGLGEELDLLAEEVVDVIADMLAEGFGIEGAAGGRDSGGQIADICAVLCLNGGVVLCCHLERADLFDQHGEHLAESVVIHDLALSVLRPLAAGL